MFTTPIYPPPEIWQKLMTPPPPDFQNMCVYDLEASHQTCMAKIELQISIYYKRDIKNFLS